MTERRKVYTLPDIAPAPYSEVQALAREVIEYGNLSAVRGLLDAIKEQGRDDDERSIRIALAAMMKLPHPLHWEDFASHAATTVWFDLFDMTEALAYLERRLAKAQQYNRINLQEMAVGIGPISHGSLVASDEQGRAIPVNGPVENYSAVLGRAINDSRIDEQGRVVVDVALMPASGGDAGAQTYQYAAGMQPPAATPAEEKVDPQD